MVIGQNINFELVLDCKALEVLLLQQGHCQFSFSSKFKSYLLKK